MTQGPQSVDWSGVSEDMARQIFAQGETFMQAQLQAALAADSRATTTASIFVTLALAVLAGGLGYLDKAGGHPIVVASLIAGGFLLIGSGFAAWAARPIDFYFPGNQPQQWFPGRKTALAIMLGGEAENYDARIAYNEAKLVANHRAIYAAFWFALASPVAGGIAWWVISS
jgi:hypothetical protein